MTNNQEKCKEFPQGKEAYCPQCYFDLGKTVLRIDCIGHSKQEKELKYCDQCKQMTNHSLHQCLKCKLTQEGDWERESKWNWRDELKLKIYSRIKHLPMVLSVWGLFLLFSVKWEIAVGVALFVLGKSLED